MKQDDSVACSGGDGGRSSGNGRRGTGGVKEATGGVSELSKLGGEERIKGR